MFAASCFALLAISIASAFAKQQTGPVTEPRAAQRDSAPVAKGSDAITERREKCSTHLIVNADALFQPHRWTLNHDAAQTLEALGPMITKTGNHPARIAASTSSSDSDADNRDVSQRRSLTVRTWLVNHHFVAADTAIGLANRDKPPASQAGIASTTSTGPSGPKNGTIEVILDTCQ